MVDPLQGRKEGVCVGGGGGEADKKESKLERGKRDRQIDTSRQGKDREQLYLAGQEREVKRCLGN